MKKDKYYCLNCGKEISREEFEDYFGLCTECYLSMLEEDYELFQIIDEDDYEDW
ncbi:MAG: hypothetical protein QXG39_07435 [Candidatus Aenigmatarchaeota archaeon]